LARDHQVGLLFALPLIHPTTPAPPTAAIAALVASRIEDDVSALAVDVNAAKLKVGFAGQSNDRRLQLDDRPHILLGDVNFDGRFDSSDLVEVLQRGKYNVSQLTRDATWIDGDWDGDGDFDADDLMAAFQAAEYGVGQ